MAYSLSVKASHAIRVLGAMVPVGSIVHAPQWGRSWRRHRAPLYASDRIDLLDPLTAQGLIIMLREVTDDDTLCVNFDEEMREFYLHSGREEIAFPAGRTDIEAAVMALVFLADNKGD